MMNGKSIYKFPAILNLRNLYFYPFKSENLIQRNFPSLYTHFFLTFKSKCQAQVQPVTLTTQRCQRLVFELDTCSWT